MKTSPEFQDLAARNPKAAALALKIDALAEETVRPLLNRFTADQWPPDFQLIIIDAVVQKLFAHLKTGGRHD